jgi:hypothetical protein
MTTKENLATTHCFIKTKNDREHYIVGKTYVIDKVPISGRCGFHCCTNFLHCCIYGSNEWSDKVRYFLVTLGSETDSCKWDKFVCGNTMTVKQELTRQKAQDSVTFRMCLKVVKQDGITLRFVPEHFKRQLADPAVENKGLALQHIDETLRSPALCSKAFHSNALAFKHVPEQFKSPNMCLNAVKRNGLNLEFVPNFLKTPDMCIDAVGQCKQVFEFVPERLQNLEMCLSAVKKHGWLLAFVADEFKTHDVCLCAVKQNGLALEHVPKSHKTQEMCSIAVKNDDWASKFTI